MPNWCGYPIPDGKRATDEDCPACGGPTILAKVSGQPARVRLDAMPIAQPLSDQWVFDANAQDRVHRHVAGRVYTTHVCPVAAPFPAGVADA